MKYFKGVSKHTSENLTLDITSRQNKIQHTSHAFKFQSQITEYPDPSGQAM